MKSIFASMIVALFAVSVSGKDGYCIFRAETITRSLPVWLAIIGIFTTHGSVRAVDLGLPTDNDAIFHGGGPAFYQYIERDYHGEKSTPWEGGQYGFVRDPEQTRSGVVYTRFHEGIDIRPVHRDENGEPLDEVRAIADGKVVYTNAVPSYSNYGKYIVIEHRWDGSPYYSLYGHLSKIDIHSGETVRRGQHIAVMGYTGEGINRDRAHLHLELNLILNHEFEGWYESTHKNDPNHHGIYNGINLTGLDIAKLYLELHENPALSIPQFFSHEEISYKIALPRSRHFELPKLYPWMVSGASGDAEPRSWDVSFARSGLPLRIEPSERKVRKPEVVYVKSSSLNASYLTNGVATGPTSHPHLTEFGTEMVRLLIWPDG
jgi:murein DD-endopeptidase MepM/ murein hydrolase activator NlpD